ncbi:MAG: EFR1 family ferrodoxin [Spirochaetales bacterium]|nr:EFR1 family ferrodoxin [Spirochaetales bacterium]
MLQPKLILNYYFSGTGNTKAMAEHFSRQLEALGYESLLKRMDRDPFEKPDREFILGLMFPVAIQSTYPNVWDFVEKLPPGEGRQVFMFDTMEAYSGGVVGPMKKLLSSKGYRCIGAREFKMSSSMNTKADKVEGGKAKNRAALKRVEQYARDLVNGKTRWGRIPLFSDGMRSISRPPKIWASFSEKLSVTDDCINCLICEKNCPVSAISHDERKVSLDHGRCICCMRCAANCPKGAILFSGKKLQLS